MGFFAFLIAALSILSIAHTQQARCFQFTWLGPRWNNESVFVNATCQDATRLARGVPCEHPLVVSNDGTWPDVEYIWTHHRDASCALADTDVCATYSYYFNGYAENSTHLCAQAVNQNGAALTSGCYEQRNGSFTTRVCLCRSVPGGVPCNGGLSTSTVTDIFIFVTVVIVIKDIIKEKYPLCRMFSFWESSFEGYYWT